MHMLVGVVIWLFISAFAFYVLGRAPNPRERSGRKLVGIGALLVALVLGMPEAGSQPGVGNALAAVGMVTAAVCLLLGLYRAYPQEWRRR